MEGAGRQRAAAREPGRLRAVGERLGPVGAVRLEGGGVAVGGIVRDQVGEGAEGARAGLAALGERRVHLGRAADQQGVAVAVHDQVVDALVPEPAPVADAEQGVPEQWPGRQVEGFGEVGAHPGLGLLLGAGVVHGERQLDGGAEVLAWTLGGVLDGDAQCLRLLGDPAQCGGEEFRVEGAVDVQALGGVLGGAERVEGLREPHAGLGGGERERGHTAPSSRAQAATAGCSARSAKSALASYSWRQRSSSAMMRTESRP